MDEIINQTAGLAQEKNLHFECLIDSNLPMLLVSDPARLKQIAINLLSNAIKFTDQGGCNFIFASKPMMPGSSL